MNYKNLVLITLAALPMSFMHAAQPQLKLDEAATEELVSSLIVEKNIVDYAQDNNFQEVKRLISEGADVNTKNEEQLCALHWAAAHNNVEMAQLLIEHHANINAQINTKGFFSKSFYLLYGHDPKIFRHMLLNGNTATPLIIATARGCVDMIHLLLKAGAEDNNPNNFFYLAIELDQLAIVDVFFNQKNSLLKDETILHIAAARNALKIIRHFAPKLNVTIRDNQKRTPLHAASRFFNFEAAELLLELGADPSLVDNHGRTPLHVLCNPFLGFSEIPDDRSCIWNIMNIATLIARPDCIDMKDSFGKTALHYAAEQYLGKMLIKYLLDHGAHGSETDNDGNTALHIAASNNPSNPDYANDALETVKYLYLIGINPNTPNKHGLTALDCALKQNPRHTEIIKFLKSITTVSPKPLRSKL